MLPRRTWIALEDLVALDYGNALIGRLAVSTASRAAPLAQPPVAVAKVAVTVCQAALWSRIPEYRAKWFGTGGDVSSSALRVSADPQCPAELADNATSHQDQNPDRDRETAPVD